MEFVSDDALVIRTQPYGENHRLVLLLTKQWGLLRALAYGAQKQHGPLYGATQTLVLSKVLMSLNSNGLSDIKQMEIQTSFPLIRQDPLLLLYATAVNELLWRLGQVEQQQQSLPPSVFFEVLACLNKLGQVSPGLLFTHLELRLLPFIGVMIDTTHCAECGAPLRDTTRFSLAKGGGLCETCQSGRDDSHAILLLPSTWRLLGKLVATPLHKLGHVKVSERYERQLALIIRLYLAEYAGVTLRSLQVIESENL